MKIWITDEEFNSHDIEKAIIREEMEDIEIIETGYDKAAILQKHGLEVVGILAQIYAKIDAETMKRLPNLKAISVYGGGFDNIDVEFASSKNIIVTRVPDYCNHEVTEYVLASMLEFARRLPEFREKVGSGSWGARAIADAPIDQWSLESTELLPVKLNGSTLLIIGYGKIGKMLARKAVGLGMKVIAYDPYAEDTAGAEMMDDLDEALARADFVSIHTPLTNETRGMIDARRIRKMKRSAFLINTSRGEIMNQRDLIEAVRNRTIRGAALDVVENEPALPSDEIFHTPEILVTPHVAYLSKTSIQELKERAARNLVLTLKGGRPGDAVNTRCADSTEYPENTRNLSSEFERDFNCTLRLLANTSLTVSSI